MQVHRDIMDGRYRAAPFAGERDRAPGSRRRRAIEEGAIARRPVLHRRGRGRQGRRAHRPVQRHRPAVPHRGARDASSARSSGRTPASARRRSSAARSSAATATSAATRLVEDGVVLGDKSVDHRLQPACRDAAMHVDPTSSRPTTSAASTRARSTRTARAPSAPRFVAYLEGEADRRRPRHAAVVARRSPRRSSTARPRRAPTSSTTA